MKSIVRRVIRLGGGDDQRQSVVRKDLSGGVNNRMHPTVIGENQAAVLDNLDISVPGQRSKRPGSILIGNDVGTDSPVALHNFEIQGATDQLLMYEDTHLHKWTGSGNWSAIKSDFTASTDVGIISAKESGLSPDDVVIVQNGQDNAFRFDSSGNEQDLGNTAGTGSDSPPQSTVMCWYGNRVWVLKNDLLYFSAAYSADYSSAFDTPTDVYRIPVGTERALIPTRDMGIVVGGLQAIWALAPSATPVAGDKPEPIVTSYGMVSKRGWVNAGDDIYFFSQDGLRSLKRTVQDKLQVGASFPISYNLKDEFDRISWAHITNLSMVYFDNKIFISVPTGAATFDTWVFYPAINSFSVMRDVNPTCWATYKVSGEQRVYYGKAGDGDVYRGWTGYTDEGTTTTNGTAITSTEEGREEDFGQPMLYKRGGEIEIEGLAAGGDFDLTVHARVDGGSYVELGSLDLQSATAPTLPVSLPFNLSDVYVTRGKFHLDDLGRFRTLQVKVVCSDTNTEVITTTSVNITTFLEEYDSE